MSQRPIPNVPALLALPEAPKGDDIVGSGQGLHLYKSRITHRWCQDFKSERGQEKNTMPAVGFTVVVLKGGDVEKDGQIVRLPPPSTSGDPSIPFTFYEDVGAKFGIDQGFTLKDLNGVPIDSYEDLESAYTVIVQPAEQRYNKIPGPRGRPVIGNLYDVTPDPLIQMRQLHTDFGPIVHLNVFGRDFVSTNDPMYAEIFAKDGEYFTKKILGILSEVKPVGGQGLFTTNTDDPDWKLAHKLLMPAFSPKAIKRYTVEMGEIAQSAAKVFDHFAQTDQEVALDFWTTCLTFETIGKIGFGFDFHLIDGPDVKVHPFISAMAFTLNEGRARSNRPQFMKYLPTSANAQYERELKLMQTTVEEVLKARKESPDAKDSEKDLLGFMLNAVDSDSGSSMTDLLIRDQVITFLIAGHETTSNTLAWTFFELSRYPAVLQKCLQEIVDVGITEDGIPTSQQVNQLKYIECCLKETLRIHSPVRGLVKECLKDIVLPGDYLIKEGQMVVIGVDQIHHNPAIYENPEEYNPDRFLPENENQRSLYSWLPFSTGPRGCLGRPFALQEAIIVTAIWLRKFVITPVTPNEVRYDPRALTTRPLNLKVKISKRTELPERSVAGSPQKITTVDAEASQVIVPSVKVGSIPFPPLTVVYGSNTGTAQDFASTIAKSAKKVGFEKLTLKTLDDYVAVRTSEKDSALTAAETLMGVNLEEIVVVVSATYNGYPPENAVKFDKWLDQPEIALAQPFKRAGYAVFGCGNSQWRTFQAFPQKIDESLEKLGGTRLVAAGKGDATQDMEHSFHEFMTELWATVVQTFGGDKAELSKGIGEISATDIDGVDVCVITPDKTEKWAAARLNTNNFYPAKIVVNEELMSNPAEASIRHVEIELAPENSKYAPGDHIEVYPVNDSALVDSVIRALGLVPDATFEINASEDITGRSLAAVINGPCTVKNALTYYADLTAPPTRSLLKVCADRLPKSESHSAVLRKLADPGCKEEFERFVSLYRTVYELIEAFPHAAKQLKLKGVLSVIQAISPRRYSIASAVRPGKENIAALTVGVVADRVKNPNSENIKTYYGLSSGFIARSTPTPAHISARVLRVKDTFRLPADPSTPLVMICGGTGLAPFLGFLQHRELTGAKGEAHLYFGCRTAGHCIYQKQVEVWEANGTLTKRHVAYSRHPEEPKTYVQDLLLRDGAMLWSLAKKGAVLYVCGNASKLAKDVRAAVEEIAAQIGGLSPEEAAKHVQELQDAGRYNEDVWG
ncbi:cytochrome P450 [Cladochytrium replicatum]|nr:cytochrome P450 [Cladochytrium replicatum]